MSLSTDSNEKKEGCGAVAEIVTDDAVLWLNMITENTLELINI